MMAGTSTGNNFETPEKSIVLISLFFCNFTKKSIPENKKIKIESSMIVLGVLLKAKWDTIQTKLSIFFSLKNAISSTKLISSDNDKKTKKTRKREWRNSLDR